MCLPIFLFLEIAGTIFSSDHMFQNSAVDLCLHNIVLSENEQPNPLKVL